MKKVLITVALLTGLTSFAQRGGHHEQHQEALKEMSAEQLATLKTKKMALILDLNESQQEQLMEINIEEAAFRKAKSEERLAKKEKGEIKRPSADERFALENERLDRKLALQQKMKQILNDEQYDQWKKLGMHKHMHSKKKMQHRSRRG